jgi:hypothetical protein
VDTDAHSEYERDRDRRRREENAPIVASYVQQCMARRQLAEPEPKRHTTGEVTDVVQPGRETMELFHRLLELVDDQPTQPMGFRAIQRARQRVR